MAEQQLPYTFETVLQDLARWCVKIRPLEDGLPAMVPRKERDRVQRGRMGDALAKIRPHMPEYYKICSRFEVLARRGEDPVRMAERLRAFRKAQKVRAMNGGDSDPLTRFINRYLCGRQPVAAGGQGISSFPL